MAEHWISAAQALKIVDDAIALCTRLHAGLIVARAKLLIVGEERRENVAVPKEFWWAQGHLALEQQWDSGDFSTWIEQKHQVQAFGVTIGLSALLEMVPFERRPLIARSLSVAGSKEWLSTREASDLVYAWHRPSLVQATKLILEQARFGFLAARAVIAKGSVGRRIDGKWNWEEREWDVPTWFWNDFLSPSRGSATWDIGRFSGRGNAPNGMCELELSGVHFHRDSLLQLVPDKVADREPSSPIKTGRKAEYDWQRATNGIWGQIYRGDLIPSNQAQIEKALQKVLANGDKEPSESMVRDHARPIWREFNKEADN